MSLLAIVTVCCLLVPFYVYFGYPAILWLLMKGRPVRNRHELNTTPSVTLIISCYNEADVIRAKLDNSLALAYPREKLSILVVSDGSDDGTDDIVKQYLSEGVELVRQEGRLGKTMGLNLAMDQVTSDLVVFSDANALYAEDAITQLVRSFADEAVGYAVGAALYTDGTDNASARNEDLYWRYEMSIKTWESQLHSVVGGDGAIYAIRRSLWERLQSRDINDFVNPLQIVAKGYRGVFEPMAKCYEETAGDFDREAARKERIVNRSFRGLLRVKEVMNPWKTGWFSFQVISHKLLRWLIPFFLVVGIAGSAVLAAQGWVLFWFVVLCATLLLVAASIAALRSDSLSLPIFLSLPYYFVLVNVYSMRGVATALLGKTQVTWSSARGSNSQGLPEKSDRSKFWFIASTGLLLLSLIWPYAL